MSTPKREIRTLELTDFSGGLNTRMDPRFIADNESPVAINVNMNEEGSIITRFGYELVCQLTGGTRTYGLIPYYKTSGTGTTINWNLIGDESTISPASDGTVTTADIITPSATVTDAKFGYTASGTATIMSYTVAPSIVFCYQTQASVYQVQFSKAINPGTISASTINTDLALSGGHTWGTVTLSWNGEYDKLNISVLSGGTRAVGDVITPAGTVLGQDGQVVTGTATIENALLGIQPKIVAAIKQIGTSFTIIWNTAIDETTVPLATLGTALALNNGHTWGTYTANFKRLMIFGSDGYMYYITDTSTTPVQAAQYTYLTAMSPNANMRGAVLNGLLILGNGTNQPIKYDGSTVSLISTYSTKAFIDIFETWGATGGSGTGAKMYGAGFSNSPSTVYFSKSGDPNDWDSAGNAGALTVSVNDGMDVTGVKALEQNLFLFKNDFTYIGQIYFDASLNASTVRLTPNKLSAGCVAPDSIAVFTNDIIRLADPNTYGITSLGFQTSVFTQNQRNGTLSWKIQPTVRSINTLQMQKSCATYFQDKYILAAPVGSAPENNSCFVYSITVDGRGYWTTWNDIPAVAFAQFKNSNNKTDLYFASNLENKLFKFNTTFSDAGSGYRRIFRTKTFTLGDRNVLKRFYNFYIRGSLSKITNDLIFRIVVDGQVEEFNINQDYLEFGQTGEAMGDNIIGDAVFGGDVGVTMNRFMYRDDFPLSIRNGREVYFELENTGSGMGWKVDTIACQYELQPRENYPMELTSSAAPLS